MTFGIGSRQALFRKLLAIGPRALAARVNGF